MGMLDKAKFWKKEEDDFGDLSDLGDFGLDTPSAQQGHPAASPPGHDPSGMGGGFGDLDSGMGDLPDLDEPTKPGMRPGVPTHMEEVQPTQASRDLGNTLGLTPDDGMQARQQQASPARPAGYPPQQRAAPQQAQQPQYAPQYAQQYPQAPGVDLGDLAKDIEIVHAKLDAIRSTLDSINQRLATLERIASGDTANKQRYNW